MKREGFSLLEVILALAILTGAMVVLGELVRTGLRNAQLARDLSQAQLLCQSKLDEIEAGVTPPQPVGQTAIPDQPGWYYSIEPAAAGGSGGNSAAGGFGGGGFGGSSGGGLLMFTVTVEQSADEYRQPVKFSITGWLRDPRQVFLQPLSPAWSASAGGGTQTGGGTQSSMGAF